jgi:YihY family inner membrane protein
MVWPGALLAAATFELAKHLYAIYARFFMNFEVIYGTLAAVIGFLVWDYYMVTVLLLGAVICRTRADRLAARERTQATVPPPLPQSSDDGAPPPL